MRGARPWAWALDPALHLESTPVGSLPASALRPGFGLPSGRSHTPERMPEVGHGHPPAALPSPGQQAAALPGTFLPVDVVVRGLVRAEDLDRGVEEVAREAQRLVPLRQHHGSVARRGARGMTGAAAGSSLATSGDKVANVR